MKSKSKVYYAINTNKILLVEDRKDDMIALVYQDERKGNMINEHTVHRSQLFNYVNASRFILLGNADLKPSKQYQMENVKLVCLIIKDGDKEHRIDLSRFIECEINFRNICDDLNLFSRSGIPVVLEEIFEMKASTKRRAL